MKYGRRAYQIARPLLTYGLPLAKSIYDRFGKKKSAPYSRITASRSRKTVPLYNKKFGSSGYTKPLFKVSRPKFNYKKTSKRSYRMKRFRRKVPKNLTMKERYMVNGFVSTLENYKSVSDPNTVSIIHSTFSRVGYATNLSSLLARKILQKIGFNPASSQETLNIPSGAFFRLIYLDQFTNNSQTVTHTVGLVPTLQSIAASFYTTCLAFFDGNSSYRFTELRYEAGGIVLHRLSLDDMVLKIWAQSVLKVQNRTLADDGTSPNTDRVDTNPIHGYLITLKGGVPQVRLGNTNTQGSFDEISLNGSGSAIGGSFAGLDAQPYRRVNFINAYYEKPCMLKPGEIKHSVISHYFAGDINNVGKLFKVETNQAETKVRACPGKCQIYGFEELIRTADTININVGYEQEITICMDMVKGSKKAIRIEHRTNAE